MTKEIAFCVPCCSYNRDWDNVYDSLLHKYFLSTLLQYPPDIKIDIFLGYNDDDKIFSDFEERCKLGAILIQNDNINLHWFEYNEDFRGRPTWIWNQLVEEAIEVGHNYFFCCGDDIVFPKDKGWINCMINTLKKNNNKGICAGDSGNPNLPMTQFLIHKNHFKIKSWVFPPLIKNWGCDNWIQEVYHKKNVFYFPQYKLLNVGGDPRYDIEFNRRFISKLVDRYRKDYN